METPKTENLKMEATQKIKIPFLAENIQVQGLSPDNGPECCLGPVREMKSRMVVTLEFGEEGSRPVGMETKKQMIRKVIQRDIKPLVVVDFDWYELNRFAFDV